jgi:hypothetical protein
MTGGAGTIIKAGTIRIASRRSIAKDFPLSSAKESAELL